jgi:hypothetical protein
MKTAKNSIISLEQGLTLLNKNKLNKKLLGSLEYCDLITEDQISKDSPRCFGYLNGECCDCDVKKFLDKENYKEILKKYGGRIRYDLKTRRWEKRDKEKSKELRYIP